MSQPPATAPDRALPWTCPFCPLHCDGFAIDARAASPTLVGSDCGRAKAALGQFKRAVSPAQPQVDGVACDLERAIGIAVGYLAASRQPLFGGLGTDVAGARALYRLACDTGAICDAAQGPALMHGLRAMQDRGAFTTTLAEVRERADVIVCVGPSPAAQFPEFFRRCGVGERREDGSILPRHVVLFGDAVDEGVACDVAEAGLGGFGALPGIGTEAVALQGDLHDAVNLLAALVGGRNVRDASAALVGLARRLLEARYAVIAWQPGTLPAQGALVVEAINRIVNSLNRSTRAAALPLGGGDGAATVNQVFTWLSGLPLRSRAGPAGLEHEPLCFEADRLLQRGAVDCLLWVQSFPAGTAPPDTRLPCIVLGHPGMAPTQARDAVFIPVGTPGVGCAGHLFRSDGVVLMPVHAVLPDGLPTVAEVLGRLTGALRASRGNVE
ncbi:MAG: formylmethanofuran dehydrogenase [Rhizobacter sp.]|nr:formylmethanofuran dehydrogenase [Rhizobacter sp.]